MLQNVDRSKDSEEVQQGFGETYMRFHGSRAGITTQDRMGSESQGKVKGAKKKESKK